MQAAGVGVWGRGRGKDGEREEEAVDLLSQGEEAGLVSSLPLSEAGEAALAGMRFGEPAEVAADASVPLREEGPSLSLPCKRSRACEPCWTEGEREDLQSWLESSGTVEEPRFARGEGQAVDHPPPLEMEEKDEYRLPYSVQTESSPVEMGEGHLSSWPTMAVHSRPASSVSS